MPLRAPTLVCVLSVTMSFFPAIQFQQLVDQLASCSKSKHARLVAAAAVKDASSLLHEAPGSVLTFLPAENPSSSDFARLIHDTTQFIKESFIPTLSSRAGAGSALLVTSPLAGAVPVAVCNPDTFGGPGRDSASVVKVRVGTINPGRTGFACLGTGHVLWWRLWDIAAACVELGLHIVVLPSPRLPQGTRLPDAFPYAFVGVQSPSWSSVAIFMAPEIAESVVLIPEVGSDARMWFLVHPSDATAPWLLCAALGPPGGEISFWSSLIEEYALLSRRENVEFTVVIGDGNIHLPGLVDHVATCRCSHCRPSSIDRTIARLLSRAGLHCVNPPGRSTHASGTVIDIVLTDAPALIPQPTVRPAGSVALSDHGLLALEIPSKVLVNPGAGFGRVWWASAGDWDTVLTSIDEPLLKLAQIINGLATDPVLTHLASSGSNVRRRRAVVNAVTWVRDAWYTLAGHLAGHVVALPAKRAHSGSRLPSSVAPTPPTHATDLSHLASMAEDREWKRSRVALSRYIALRGDDRGAADRFLSRLVRPKEVLQLALRDSANALLGTHGCIESIEADLRGRSTNTSTRCPVHHAAVGDFVAKLRNSRALLHPRTGATLPDTQMAFTPGEVGEVISQLSRTSVSLRGCYAAVKASSIGGRAVTLAIVNICFNLTLFPSSATLREFNPIRKKGPKVVHSLSCLRPISFSSDLAAVLDALILRRCRSAFVEFWGPGQSGGVYDALLCVLAVVLISQLRLGVGLPLLLLFLDLASAFDVADRDDMRRAVFDSGIHGRLWLLIDDLLSSDHARVHVGDLLSSVFKLDAGVAQGRRLSVALFNGQMRYLHDTIASASRGVGAWCNRWPRRVIELASITARPAFHEYDVKEVKALGVHLRSTSSTESAAAHVLSSSSSTPSRLGAVDELAPCRVIDLQYVDDLVAPASSSEHIDALWSGAVSFTHTQGGTFNTGPSKSAVLPIGVSRYVSDTLAPVEQYTYLGVVLDRWLSFSAQLAYLVRKGREAFLDFLGCALSIFLPMPLQACAVSSRIEPVVLYGCEFCIQAPDAERTLNRLQSSWCRHLLGFPESRAGSTIFLVAECGWRRRLGTTMFERAVLLKARAQLLLASHPAHQLLAMASSSMLSSWAERVSILQQLPSFEQPIPDITACTPTTVIAQAQVDPEARRACLASYRRHYVTPAFDAYDRCAFQAACDNTVWPYYDYQCPMVPFPDALLLTDWSSDSWRFYKAWACIRVLGRWPLEVFSAGGTPLTLDACPLCDALEVDIAHLLMSCAGVLDLRLRWFPPIGLPAVNPECLSWEVVRIALFAGRLSPHGEDVDVAWSRIQFVGSCASRATASLSTPAAADAIDHLISAACNAAAAEIARDCDAPLVSPTGGS